MTTKQQIRHFIRQRKQELLTEERRALAARRLLNILRNRKDFAEAKTVLLYSALPDEVPTEAVLKEWGSEKVFLLPSLLSDGTSMVLKTYSTTEAMIEGRFHILEPRSEVFTDYSHIDLAFIPGVAFDEAFHRCGRGKGYYDRFLAHPQLQFLRTVGIAFDFQLVSEIPIEAHDKQLHDVIIV